MQVSNPPSKEQIQDFWSKTLSTPTSLSTPTLHEDYAPWLINKDQQRGTVKSDT